MDAIQALSNATYFSLPGSGGDAVLHGLDLLKESNPYMAVIGVVGTLFNLTETYFVMRELK
jgi:hypothetical protein